MLGCRGEAAGQVGLPQQLQRQEIVFLLDASQSMVAADPLRLMPETALEMCAMLPANWAVGIYAYSDQVSLLQPLAGLSRLPAPALQEMQYGGYTNTGAAMQQAVTAFAADGASARSIVIVTDGEIMLPTSEETVASVKAFQEAMAACRERGIRVYVLALGGSQTTPQANIYASDITYATAPDMAAVPAVGAQLLAQNWAIGKSERTADASGRADLSLPVPASAVRHLRLVVRKGDGSATQAKLVGQDSGHQVYDGPSLTIWDIKNPAAHMALTGLPAGQQVELYPQLTADLQAELVAGEADDQWLKLSVRTADGDRQALLDDRALADKEIAVWLDNDYYPGHVRDGSIWVELPQDWQGAENILPVFSAWGWNVDCTPASLMVTVPEKKKPAEGSSVPWLLAIGGGAGALVLIGLLVAVQLKTRRQRRRQRPLPAQQQPVWAERYVGELTIRDIRTRSGRDHRVRVLNLYRHLEHTALPLRRLFHECQLPDTLPGLDGLSVHPGKAGIWLDNDSQATLLKDGELILRGTSCFMGYDEPVQLSFGDEQLALTMVLKDLKPQT